MNPDVEGSGGFWAGIGSGGGGGARCMLGVNGLFGVEAEGSPSSVVQPPLLKLDGGRIVVMWCGSEGGGGGGEGGFSGAETVVHPGFLKPPLDDEVLTVDQPPTPNSPFFNERGVGSVPGVGTEPSGFCVVPSMLTTGVTVASFTPAALATFRSSFSSLFLSFSLRFSTTS